MSVRARHFLLAAALTCSLSAAARGEPGAGGAPSRTDALGDPLPPGALLRLGSIRLRHPNFVTSVSFAADGKILATACSDGAIRLWEFPSGRLMRILQSGSDLITRVAFSPDGKNLASDSYACLDPSGKHQHGVRLWDARSGRLLREIMIPGSGVRALAFSPDGRRLASGGGDLRFRLWEVGTGRDLLKSESLKYEVHALAFAPDGCSLLTGGYGPGKKSFLQLWEIRSGRAIWEAEGVEGVHTATFAPDGKSIFIGGGLYDSGTGKRLKRLQKKAAGMFAVAPDGRTVAESEEHEGHIRLTDWKAGRELRRLPYPRGIGSLTHLVFSPDGKALAGSNDAAVLLWDVANGQRVGSPSGHEAAVAGVSYAPDGRTLATRGLDQTLRIWETATGREVRRIELGTYPHYHRLDFPIAQCVA